MKVMKFDDLIDKLRQMRGSTSEASDADVLEFTEFCLRQYVDNWICGHCNTAEKIPSDHKNPRVCPVCRKDSFMMYGYKEQERMSNQLNACLKTLEFYALQTNGAKAIHTLAMELPALQKVSNFSLQSNKK